MPNQNTAKTQKGRLRLEHRHGWLDAVWQGTVVARRDRLLFLIFCTVGMIIANKRNRYPNIKTNSEISFS